MPDQTTAVPLPEKVVIDRHLPTGVVIYGYTSAQLLAYGDRRAAEAVERAVKIIDSFPYWLGPQAKQDLVAAIKEAAIAARASQPGQEG